MKAKFRRNSTCVYISQLDMTFSDQRYGLGLISFSHVDEIEKYGFISGQKFKAAVLPQASICDEVMNVDPPPFERRITCVRCPLNRSLTNVFPFPSHH